MDTLSLIDSGAELDLIDKNLIKNWNFYKEKAKKTHWPYRTVMCHDLAKQLSYYLYFFFLYYIGRSVGKCYITSITWS